MRTGITGVLVAQGVRSDEDSRKAGIMPARMAPAIELPGGLLLEWVEIPAGRFLMGSQQGRDDERPVREVELPAFGLGRTPVTREQYAVYLRETGAPPPPGWDDARFGRPRQPVVGVSWLEAAAFTAWLSRVAGREVRLPSEAEWERAMRGGLEQQPTPWGLVLPIGEIPDRPLEAPWDVGRGTPNGFGLLDPGTLVHEWCLDWYATGCSAVAPGTEARDPEAGGRRASRGGSWRRKVRWSPPSARSSLPPEFHYADYGLRVRVASGRAGRRRRAGGPAEVETVSARAARPRSTP